MDGKKWAFDNLIHKIYAGSRLYGTERPDSDYDERGVCLMPPMVLLGITGFEQYNHQHGDQDVVIYGITKFFKLASACNPNILELLFAPPETWQVFSEQWDTVYSHRHDFLSERVRHTFSGYARSQLKRLQGHYRWLTSPPSHKPTPEEYGGWVEKNEKGGQKLNFPHLDARHRYRVAAREWTQYQTWLRERNPARAELERQYGYDTKHACNLVRMMIQGETLLSTGTFNPRLEPDVRDLVLDVLHGGWEYFELMDWSAMMEDKIRGIETALPHKPDYHHLETLLMAINATSVCPELVAAMTGY